MSPPTSTSYQDFGLSGTVALNNGSGICFDKVFDSVGPGETRTFTFWQWFYDTTSWNNIQTAIQEDCAGLN